MEKVVAIMNKPKNCEMCIFSLSRDYLSFSTNKKSCCCLLKEPDQRKVEEFDRKEEVHISDCPLKPYDVTFDVYELMDLMEDVRKNLELMEKELDNMNDTRTRILKHITKEPEFGGWIPCSERLPEESLNSVLGWDEYRQRCCLVQYLRGRFVLGNDLDSVKIVAWQPLPEPYRKE